MVGGKLGMEGTACRGDGAQLQGTQARLDRPSHANTAS